MNFNITFIRVLLTENVDRIYIHTDLPSPFPPDLSHDHLILSCEAQRDSGVNYVQQNFGLDPEVLDARPKR